jgi:hypothetical protein
MQSNDAIVDETKDDHRKREQRRTTTVATAIKRAAYLIREAVSEDVVEDIFYVDGDDDVNVNDMELRTADISTTNRTISMYCRRICRQMIVLRILFGTTTTAAGTTTIRYNRFVQIICLLFSFMSILLEHITQNQQYTQYNPYIRLILLYTFLTSSSHRDVQILIGVVPVCFYLFSDYLSLFLGAGSSLSTRVLND